MSGFTGDVGSRSYACSGIIFTHWSDPTGLGLSLQRLLIQPTENREYCSDLWRLHTAISEQRQRILLFREQK